MSRKVYTIEKGLRITGQDSETGLDLLQGSGAPGGDAAEQDAAGQGSLYMRSNGFAYVKKTAGTGADKWDVTDHLSVKKAGDTMTGTLDMGSNKITSSYVPVDGNDLTNKTYVDNLISGINWKDTVELFNLLGNDTVVNINGFSPSNGDQYVMTSAGTLTDGSLAVAIGDCVEYQTGTGWVLIAANVGGFVASGARAILGGAGGTIQSPYTDTTDNDKIVSFGGASNTGVDTGDTVDNSAVLISDPNSVSIYDNLGYVYDGTVPSGSWIQFTGAGQIVAGDGLSKDGNTLNVNVDDSTIEINADTLRLKAGGITNSHVNAAAAIDESKLNLDYATATLNTNISDLVTLSGRPVNSTHMGTYTGSIITDNQTIKQNIQELETAVESLSSGVAKQLIGVTSVQVLDSVLVDDILASEWELHMREDATPTKVQVQKVFASHNGHSGADASQVDDSVFGKLVIGAAFNKTVIVDISGVGAAQVMRLTVASSTGGVTFTSRRTDVQAP